MTGKCTENDLKPVLQVIDIDSPISFDDNQWVWLSDGSFEEYVAIDSEILISNKLQQGSIIQLTKYHILKESVIWISDCNLLCSKCDIIGDPKLYPRNDIPLVEGSTPPIRDEDHVDVSHAQEKCSETQSRKRKHQSSNETPVLERSKPTIIDHDRSESDTNEDVDNSHPAQEPSATTQKCSSHSLNQSQKRKRQSSNDNISKVVADVSKMTKLMMEKIKTVDVGFKRLETLEEDVSRMTIMMMEKSKEDVVGFKKLETLEVDVSKMMKMMEKNKEDDVGARFKKLETLEENVSKLTRMMMEKNKEDDMGACIEKLDKIGWVAQDPMYDTALLLFGQSADYRKLWLHLKPESCGNWVKNAGNMFGLLD